VHQRPRTTTERARRAALDWHDALPNDLVAGIVVFLVALPLCLGIAFASGAPLAAGLLAGVIGGLIVTPLSRAPLAVSGPAAGLIVIVVGAVSELGSLEAFGTAVCLAGLIQVALGFARAGVIAYFFPAAVIRGMLAGIGVVLVLKQLPHAVGWDRDFEGDLFFEQADGRNTFTEIPFALGHFHLGASIIAVGGLAVLIAWPRIRALARAWWLPAPLVAVVLGVGLNLVFDAVPPDLSVREHLLVSIPGPRQLMGELRLPSLAALADPRVWEHGIVLALVASVETLLCVEAIDKLDPLNRTTPTNRELKAQGVGNLLAGLVGALPITAVIVRGSTNVQAGGLTRVSSFVHGVLLLVAVLVVPGLLSMIPIAALAAVLLHVGYRLAPISLFRRMWRMGPPQFLPFVATTLGVIFTDLLMGVLFGMAFSVLFILQAHISAPYGILRGEGPPDADGVEHVRLELADNVSFLNKAGLSDVLHGLAPGTALEIDATRTKYLDPDARDVILDFVQAAPLRGVEVRLVGFDAPGSAAG
jgi:carbonic anhydrase